MHQYQYRRYDFCGGKTIKNLHQKAEKGIDISTHNLLHCSYYSETMGFCQSHIQPLNEMATILQHESICFVISVASMFPMFHLGPLLLTWFNFNPSMDKLSHAW